MFVNTLAKLLHMGLPTTLLKRFARLLIPALCFSSALAFATPNIQHWQSASGAKVLFVEDHDIPMLDVAVTVQAGSSFDAADKSGVAGLTHQLLDAGADGLSEDEISRGMADIGAQFGGSFDQDRSSMSLRTLSSAAERDKALDHGTRAAAPGVSGSNPDTRKNTADRRIERGGDQAGKHRR
jgi:hypothetical protein